MEEPEHLYNIGDTLYFVHHDMLWSMEVIAIMAVMSKFGEETKFSCEPIVDYMGRGMRKSIPETRLFKSVDEIKKMFPHLTFGTDEILSGLGYKKIEHKHTDGSITVTIEPYVKPDKSIVAGMSARRRKRLIRRELCTKT